MKPNTRYVIISGSTRPNSQSLKVSTFLQNRLAAIQSDSDIKILSLENNPLPHWDEAVWADGYNWDANWKKTANILKDSDALIIVSPEWGGMAPPALKNLFQLCTDELIHKPALLFGVSSGLGGSYPIVELRMSSYKNTKLCYLPEHIIIRQVNTMLNSLEPNDENDLKLRERIDQMLKILIAYTHSFKDIRQNSAITENPFAYGM